MSLQDNREQLLKSLQVYPDLAVDSNGGEILFATDDFFAVAENMIAKTEPQWIETKYTEYGLLHHFTRSEVKLMIKENGWMAGKQGEKELKATITAY